MAFIRGANVVTDGLVLALDAANPKSYISGSTVWRDLSGITVTGSLVNGPGFNSANGGSIQFDGVDDYLLFNGITLNTNTGFTFDTWINILDPQPVYANFWAYFYHDGAFEWGTYASGSLQGTFLFKDNLAAGSPSITSPYIANSFANLIIGCNSTIPFMYVNGVFIGNTTAFRNTSFTITNLCRSQNINRNYKTNLSNIKIYNRALSPTEILQNYNATKARFGIQ